MSGAITVKDDEEPRILLRSVQPLIDNASWQEKAENVSAVTPPSQTAPQSGAKKAPSRLFLRVPSMNSEEKRRAECFLSIFPGPFPVVFYDQSCGKYYRAENLSTVLSDFTVRELGALLGADSVILR